MESSSILSLALLSGIVGFATYSLSCALHVWKKRNASIANQRGPGRIARGIGGMLVACGVLLAMAGFIARAATSREGRLYGDGLFTVRPPEKLRVEWVAPGPQVAEGEALARFHSPEAEARIASLKLKQQMLRAEEQAAQAEALELDRELVRRQQEARAERRHLEASRDQLGPSRDLVDREHVRDVADRKDELSTLESDLEALRDELGQAVARADLADRQLQRIERLAGDNVASAEERDQRQAAAIVNRTEVSKLQQRIAARESQIGQLRKDLERVESLAVDQSRRLAAGLNRIAETLGAIADRDKALQGSLDEDVERASALREACIQRLALEGRQAAAELEGISRSLIVAAPFAGRLAYRNPSPRAAHDDDPLCVLAPADSLRLQVRLPAGEARHLQRQGPVTLQLDHGIERRFSGHLAGWRDLAHDPGYVLAELACDVPGDAARDLAAGEPVIARLKWFPPAYSIPLCQLGASVAVAGILLFSLSSLSSLRRRPAAHPSQGSTPARDGSPRLASIADPSGAMHVLEAGATGVILVGLGRRLREAIRTQDLAPDLLAAVEWSLDRHHVRAIHHLAEGLGHDSALRDELERLIETRGRTGGTSNGNGDGRSAKPSIAAVERLACILSALAVDHRISALLPGPLAGGAPVSVGTAFPRQWMDLRPPGRISTDGLDEETAQ